MFVLPVPRLRRRLAAVTGVLALTCVLLVGLAGASQASDACTPGTSPGGQSVRFCGVWVPAGGVPVYAGSSAGSSVVDHLHTGGTANWFLCSKTGATTSAAGYTSNNWARTVGDDHGATGYVPAVYFSGVENYWYGLPACGDSGSGGAACTSGTSHAGASVYYCPIWTPGGGAPVYSGTSTSATVVDHLLTAGSGNWFTCQQNGGTATASGYTSSNWAKTVGDVHGATGWVPAVYFNGAQNYWNALPACATSAPPPPADGACTAGHNGAATVYYCPVWLPSGGVPVYAGTAPTTSIVDRLHTGGPANWFLCSVTGSTATSGGYSSSDWAKTVGDDHGATGYVPAIYFTGAQNYWPNLPKCSAGSTNPPPPPPPANGGASTSGSACGRSFSGIPTLTLRLIQNACRVTVSTDTLYQYRIYAWGGGHAASPGPSRGSCSPQNGAPNDCNVIGFDCSGLVRYAYYLTTGLDGLDGVTWQQWPEALSLPHAAVIDGAARSGNSGNVTAYESQLRPGDILWYGQNAGQHVAVYLGNGQQMNAYQSGLADGVTGVTTSDTFWGAVRLW